MSTILEIIQNFCYRTNVPAPTSIVGVASQTERQYLSLFQQIGDMLRNNRMPWSQLKRTHTFTTVSGTREYKLPGDFYRLLPANQWDQTNQWPLLGPLSDAMFTERDLAVLNMTTRKSYRIVGPTSHLFSISPYSQRSPGNIQILPTPDNSSDVMFLGYQSCNWIWPKDWVAGVTYSAGSLVSGNGYVYHTTAGGVAGATRPTHSSGSASDGTVTWTVYKEPYPCTPSNSKLNDSDICLFDENLMIDGLVWANLKSKKLDYMQERIDWEKDVAAQVSRFDGDSRINMNDYSDEDQDFPRGPEGGWSV